MSERMRLEGSIVALVTPFAGGEVDFDALGRLVEYQLDNGTQGLVPCGSTGESPTLTHEEHDRVIEFVVDRARGRVPVIAGTGSNSTEEALRLTKHAKSIGADACLLVNPYYNKPTQEGIYLHVKAVAEVGLPIVIYNNPWRTGVELTAKTIARMYHDIPQVVADKEATGKLDLASAIANRCDITILSGDDSLTVPLCSVGAKGVVSVLANLLPREVRNLCDAVAANDLAEASRQHLKLFPLFKAMFVETNPIPIKAAMAMAGMIENELRMPLTPLREELRADLAAMLRQYMPLPALTN
jgi:4-hydroxy-tetrahydrodipicolinate synthase